MTAPWNEVPIAAIAQVARGGSPRPIKNYITDDPSGVNWIKIGDTERGGRYIQSTKEKIRREGIKYSRLVDEGDFLLSNSMSFGRPYILKISGCIHDGWLVLKPDYSRVDQGYLYYALGSPDAFRQFDSLAAGSTVRNLNIDLVSGVTIPLPPLEEQKRIVAVLDQAFAALDRARANAEANLADAELLFGNWIASIFDPSGVTNRDKKTIGDVCQIQSGAGFPVKEQGRIGGQYPFYKVSDMNLAGNEWWLTRANNYIDEAARKRLRAAIFPRGSIVFPKVGGAINTNKKRVIEAEGCVDNNIMGLIPDASRILPEFLHEWLHSVDIYDFSNKANPPSITQGTVLGWPLRVPSHQEQAETVESIKAMRRTAERLRQLYSETLADIADLRQSILQEAFSGQLTA